MVRLGIALHTKKFFEVALEEFRSRSKILIAHREGIPIASMLLLYGTGVATYPVQNVLFEYRNHAPIQLLTWEAMKQAMYSGASFLDMGPSRIGSNVFGAKEFWSNAFTTLQNFIGNPAKEEFLGSFALRFLWPLTLMRGLRGHFG